VIDGSAQQLIATGDHHQIFRVLWQEFGCDQHRQRSFSPFQ
jgi:hypothetical protein